LQSPRPVAAVAELGSLDLMTLSRDPTTLVCGGLYIFLALYAAGLWAFALFRTGMVFCRFFIVAAVFSASISVVTVAMYLDPYIGVRIVGREPFRQVLSQIHDGRFDRFLSRPPW